MFFWCENSSKALILHANLCLYFLHFFGTWSYKLLTLHHINWVLMLLNWIKIAFCKCLITIFNSVICHVRKAKATTTTTIAMECQWFLKTQYKNRNLCLIISKPKHEVKIWQKIICLSFGPQFFSILFFLTKFLNSMSHAWIFIIAWLNWTVKNSIFPNAVKPRTCQISSPNRSSYLPQFYAPLKHNTILAQENQ